MGVLTRRSVGPRRDLGGTRISCFSQTLEPGCPYARAGDVISLLNVKSQLTCDSLRIWMVCSAPSLPIWHRPLRLSSHDRVFNPGGDHSGVTSHLLRTI